MATWLSRCVPGFCTLLLVTLLVLAFCDVDLPSPILQWGESPRPNIPRQAVAHPEPAQRRVKLSQKLFIYYYLFVHADTVGFALRLCLSIVLVKRKLKATLRRRHDPPSSFSSESDSDSLPLDYVQLDPHHSHLFPGSSDPKLEEVIHAIIVPNYEEDIDTLRTTLAVLASHPRAATQYEVYLAMEQKETSSGSKAALLMSAFDDRFLAVRSTFHPNGLPGEIAGKSSNVAFTAREIFRRHGLEKNKDDVIITVIDSDTHLLQDYFTEIYRSHRANPDFSRALYVCPIVFDRNSHDTNFMVRVADILWGCAGLASNFPGSSIHIPTSVYSLPLTLAEDIGGWDVDATAIGEDMHMFLKCYFNTRGTVVTIPIHSPASQCNLSSGFSMLSWRRTLDNIGARYRQARRHMWGCLDTGYAVRRMVRTRSIRLSHIPLFHLLWEAHLLPSHFVLMLLASALYTLSTPRSEIPPLLLWAFSVSAVLRNISFLLMQLVFSLYEDFHALCVYKRASDMRDAGIPDSDTMFAYRKPLHWTYLAERVSFPIAGILFGTLPALQAQICHFWTDKLVYTVTAKPLFALQAAAKRADMS